jgi:hypothetical protein
MFGTIRKHQNWLWAVIITLTIISFVIFFSPYSKMNTGVRRSGNFGSINGQKVTEQQYLNAWREVDLAHFLMTGRWLHDERKDAGGDPEREVYQWLLLVQKQEQLGIHVGDDAAAQSAQQVVHAFERQGINSPSSFIQKVLQPNGVQLSDFERYVRHFVGVQELINTFGLSGKLITPQQARLLYERENQEVSCEALFFSASNYLASVQATPEAISQFYSNRVAIYAVPERVQVSYVKFAVTNFMPQAETELTTNLNELVEMNYQRLGTNLFADAKTPEEAKAKIREQLIKNQALSEARKKAMDFANVLFDLKPARPDNLQELARTNGLVAAVTAPFDREEGPKDLEAGPDFAKTAFSLTAEDPFGGPILGRDGVYVIALAKQLPREIPLLDQIHDRVAADYKLSQAISLAMQKAQTAYQALTNGLAQGKSFTNICAETDLKPMQLPPFSLTTHSLPQVEEFVGLDQLKRATFSTAPGKVTPLQPLSEGAMIVYVKTRLPVDQAKMQSELPNFVNNARRLRQKEAFDMWLRHEIDVGLRDTPVGQPKRPPALGSAASAKS